MKKWAPFLFLQLACAMVLSLSVGHVHAGFADSFRAFVLDGETATPSKTTSIATLPSSSQSASCMQCHNGSRATSITLKHADAAMTYSRHTNTNHPVGMSYSQYAARQPYSYVQPGQLNPRIRLEDGQVTCISCHEVKEKSVQVASTELTAGMLEQSTTATDSCTATKNLTTGPNRSELCMSCHAM